MNSNDIDRGKLKVSVLTDRSTTPVSGATVRISDSLGGETLEELTTDASGQTEEISLPAPPVEYSISEQDQKPYASYNVTIKADGLETLYISGVQVFPNSVSIQNADLRLAHQNGFNVRNLLIQPNVLWGDYPAKIPEDEVKPLPEAEGFVVLPEPVIPEFVVVHLGKPDDSSAENAWIYFKDYIKNVASSEIYPTWTQETIKANVLAILSFTLNRVYTEWYRGKGYNFTITNSTAYDQAFQRGRNIYESISIAVDDLFNTYITKPGIEQPLFAQYCDGRRVQCKGLSQWGSQALGEQGLSAVDILKRYYGSEIYLKPAEKIEGVPQSYGGTVLKTGSTGSDVRVIQNQLNGVSDHFPAIPKLKVDGFYGENTENAVKTFQKIFNLPQTGEVDFATWYEISNIFVSVSQISSL